MPSEAKIRKKAIEILTDKKWVCWFPKKVKFHETDIWGIADLICCQKKRVRFIQLTTLPNVSAKRRKILSFCKKNRVEIPVEIWGWHQKRKEFRRERVSLKKNKKRVK